MRSASLPPPSGRDSSARGHCCAKRWLEIWTSPPATCSGLPVPVAIGSSRVSSKFSPGNIRVPTCIESDVRILRTSNSRSVRVRISAATVTAFLLVGSAAAGAQSVNDAQIASIVVTANQVDIDAGQLASKMATNPEVKKFGATMVTDHTGVNKAASDLATRLKVTPEDNATSKALKAGGEKNVANLKTLKGAAFDKAYIDHEVAYHTQVLEAIDTTLVPNAKNAELKALIVKVRPAFVAHLEHAKSLQKTLAGK